MSHPYRMTDKKRTATGFVRGFRAWVRRDGPVAKPGAVRDGYYFAAAVNDYFGGRRPEEHDADRFVSYYMSLSSAPGWVSPGPHTHRWSQIVRAYDDHVAARGDRAYGSQAQYEADNLPAPRTFGPR